MKTELPNLSRILRTLLSRQPTPDKPKKQQGAEGEAITFSTGQLSPSDAQSPPDPSGNRRGTESPWVRLREMRMGGTGSQRVPRAARHCRLSLGNMPVLTANSFRASFGVPPRDHGALSGPLPAFLAKLGEIRATRPRLRTEANDTRPLSPASPCRGRQSCRCPSLGTGRLCQSALHLGILQARRPRLR